MALRRGLVPKSACIVALIVIGFSALGIILGHSLEKIESSVLALSESAIPVSAAAYEMEINTLGTGLAVTKYMLRPDASHYARIAKDRSDFETFLAEYRSVAQSDEEKELLASIEHRYQEFREAGERMLVNKDDYDRIEQQLWMTLLGVTQNIEDFLFRITPDGSEESAAKHKLLKELEYSVDKVRRYLLIAEHLAPATLLAPTHFKDVHGTIATIASSKLTQRENIALTGLARQVEVAEAELAELQGFERSIDAEYRRFLTLREILDALLDEEIQVIAAAELANAKELSSRAVVAAYRTVSVGSGIAAVTLGLVVALVLQSIVQPLRKVAAAAVAFGKGNLDQRLSFFRKDEIGDVVSAFNEMAQNVQRSKYELDQMNTNLERMVEERTLDLQQANNDLEDEVKSHKATADQLSQAICQIEAAHTARASLVGNVNHEFRTPLNAILGFAEVLRMGTNKVAEPSRYADYLDGILSSGHRLLSIVNELVDLSQAERGVLRVSPVNVDIGTALDVTLGHVGWRAARKDVQIQTDVPEDLPCVWADRLRIEQVLTNVVDNAIKFTRPGTEVSIKSFARDGFVIVSVVDNGQGMSAQQLARVFEPFSTESPLTASDNAGAHIGLALSKRILELQSGELAIDSSPGAGTSVTIRLPTSSSAAI